ncbi:MAG: hypothetical protein LH606_17475 [Cytophagaceae bacterium]|nr:hypothetical protein [Cytophagaceae bacterium]
MDEKERRELQALKSEFERILQKLNQEIIDFPLDGDEEEYKFKSEKAIYFRDLLKRVNRMFDEN